VIVRAPVTMRIRVVTDKTITTHFTLSELKKSKGIKEFDEIEL
jgi:hypothetical protein